MRFDKFIKQMKKVIIILILLSLKLYSQNFPSIPLIEPLEVTIHKNFLVNLSLEYYNSNLQQKMGSFSLELRPYQFQRSYYMVQDKYNNFQINAYYSYSFLHYFYNKSKINKDYLEFEIIPFLNQQNTPWYQQNQQFYLRTSLVYGKNLGQGNQVSAILGIINEQQLERGTLEHQNIIQYGKIFFMPGIQLRSNSVVLKTFLEMPLYRYNFVNDTQKLILPTKENINANFQIQVNQ